MLLILLVQAIIVCSEGKYFETNCDLVHELRRHGFDENKMADWLCLINSESGRRTNIISPVNKNGSRDYGLFQINNKWWCNKGSAPGKECNITCGDLLTDDITVASNCAKLIFKERNFYAWNGWRQRCQGELPDISNC